MPGWMKKEVKQNGKTEDSLRKAKMVYPARHKKERKTKTRKKSLCCYKKKRKLYHFFFVTRFIIPAGFEFAESNAIWGKSECTHIPGHVIRP